MTANKDQHVLLCTAIALCLMVCTNVVHASRFQKFEFSLLIPYAISEDVDFEGGASVSINSDPGIGFGMGYNFSDRLAFKSSLTWNSTSYDATRVLDDGLGTEQGVTGVLDIFTAAVGNDFYLTKGPLAPFVNVNVGWAAVDSNIADGGALTTCWWDPWWGYICNTYSSTYTENYWFYGAGAGIRFDLNRNHFIRVSYNKRWLDFDNASGSNGFDNLLLEFGFSY